MENIELNIFDDEDIIEPCRTCGIYFLSNHSVIQPIFTKSGAGDIYDDNMKEIVQQMNEWQLEVNINDGRPQYMCLGCIGEFEKVLKFKRSCVETQEQFDELDYKRIHNGVVIKKEIDQPNEEKFCGFIYVDSDDEEGSEEDGSRRVCAPLDIPHVPIKEEHTARVPQDTPYQPALPAVSNLPDEATFAQVKPEELAVANGFSSTLFQRSPQPTECQNTTDEEIIKFTYEDDEDSDVLVTLPAPIEDPGIYCKLCGHASDTQKQHTDHMSRVHLLKDCECHICGKKFANAQESRLRFHMKWHKLQKHLKCPICGFFCNSKDTLKEHKLAVHTRTKCDFCGKSIKHKMLQAHLNQHIQEHEEEIARKMGSMQTTESPEMALPDLIQCAFCEFTFEDSEELQQHVLTVHRTPPKQQQQQHNPEVEAESEQLQMDKIFKMPAPIEPPPAVVETEKQRSTSAMRSNANSRQHSSRITRQEKSISECKICGKTFDLKIKLNRHMKQH